MISPDRVFPQGRRWLYACQTQRCYPETSSAIKMRSARFKVTNKSTPTNSRNKIKIWCYSSIVQGGFNKSLSSSPLDNVVQNPSHWRQSYQWRAEWDAGRFAASHIKHRKDDIWSCLGLYMKIGFECWCWLRSNFVQKLFKQSFSVKWKAIFTSVVPLVVHKLFPS